MTRVIFLLIIFACGLFVLYELAQVWHRIKIGTAIANTTTPYQQQVENPTHRILVLGDSTAVGTGTAKPEESIAGRIGAALPHARIDNYAVNGQRAADLAKKIKTLPAEQYDLVLMQIGANDIIRFTPLPQFESSLNTIMEEAKKRGTHVVALHSGNVGAAPFFPRFSSWLFSWRARQVRERYMPIAKKYGVLYVDLYTSRSDDPFLSDTDRFYAADGLHLSGVGYAHWYEKIKQTLDDNSVTILESHE